jgi:prepilin-type N-terminal cleavage/methylation domain-containing protein
MKKLNNRGFSLIELLGSLALLTLIFCIGLYNAGGTLSTALTTLDNISDGEIKNAAEIYIIENPVSWINDGNEWTCITTFDLVDKGYFDDSDVTSYKDKKIKLVRDSISKVITNVSVVDSCE